MSKRPNILVFMTDGQRADTLGCYGNEVLQTPNVDGMAREGLVCSQSFCSHTVCMPTRASVFTGRYPHVTGVWANGITLDPREVTLSQVLAENGYRTCACGKIHLESQASPDYPPTFEPGVRYYGFDEVHLSENKQGEGYLCYVADAFPSLLDTATRRGRLPEEAHALTWITERTIEFVETQASAGRPFFAFCSFHELIPPCNPPAELEGLYTPEQMPAPKVRESELDTKPPLYRACYEGSIARGRFPDEDRLRDILVSYYTQATFLDKLFGRLLQTLDRLGIRDETIVLFTSDHGLVLGDHWLWRHGPFLFEQVIRVPMVWSVPGPGEPGGIIDAFVESVDVMPTLLDLVDLDVPAGVQGRSMAGMLRGGDDVAGKESVLVQDRESPELRARGVDPTGVRLKSLRTRDWKLIHHAGQPYGELYDLVNDPDEFVNLWGDPGYGRARREMEGRLLERLCEAEDPLPERRYEW